MAKEKHISIPLGHISENLELHIFPEGESKVFKIEEAEAIEFGEFPFQILESQSYEYAFNNKSYRLSCDNKGLVKQSHRENFSGKINPSFYVGTLKLNITHKEKELKTYKHKRKKYSEELLEFIVNNICSTIPIMGILIND